MTILQIIKDLKTVSRTKSVDCSNFNCFYTYENKYGQVARCISRKKIEISPIRNILFFTGLENDDFSENLKLKDFEDFLYDNLEKFSEKIRICVENVVFDIKKITCFFYTFEKEVDIGILFKLEESDENKSD